MEQGATPAYIIYLKGRLYVKRYILPPSIVQDDSTYGIYTPYENNTLMYCIYHDIYMEKKKKGDITIFFSLCKHVIGEVDE